MQTLFNNYFIHTLLYYYIADPSGDAPVIITVNIPYLMLNDIIFCYINISKEKWSPASLHTRICTI